MREPIFHLVPAAAFEAQTVDGRYVPASFADEGFVHLSAAHQVPGTAANLFADAVDLLVLAIDADGLDDLRWEDLYGHGDFPHQYGPIPTSAIIGSAPYRPGDDGRFGDPTTLDFS